MTLLADRSADVGSNLVQGTGTNSLTFTMPGNIRLDVESVVATVNNAAGGDTTAEIVIRDQAGTVIATNAQSEVIPAGDTGTATFALRVVDKQSTTGFLHWGTNTDASAQGLTLTGHGPFSFTTAGDDFTLDAQGGVGVGGDILLRTKAAGSLTLDATSANFSVKNQWTELHTNTSSGLIVDTTSLDINASGAVTLDCVNDITITSHLAGNSGGEIRNKIDIGHTFRIVDSAGVDLVKVTA